MPGDDRDRDRGREDVLFYLHFDSDRLADYLTSHPLFQKPQPPARDAQPPARAAKEREPSSHSTHKTLRLRFLRDRPKGKHGLLIGSSPSCHIVLNHPSIARFHGALTFDEHHRLIYRDLGSWHGSSVTYERSGFEKSPKGRPDPRNRRRDFTWIVGGPDVPAGGVLICLGGEYSMLLTVPVRDWTSAWHQHHVGRFLAASRGGVRDVELQDEIEAELVRRAGPAERTKPVLRSWPLFLPTHAGGFEAFPLPQRNITQCLDTNLTASSLILRPRLLPANPVFPRLYLEYAPHGSLENLQSALRYRQAVSVTHQCLDALAYLHGHSLVHRSIKPSNILITCTDPIRVQLTDFGAATVSDRQVVLRRSAPWFAPEMHAAIDAYGNRTRRGINGEEIAFDSRGVRAAGKMVPLEYGAAVDIWALGVVAMDLAWPGKLPAPDTHTWSYPRWKLIRNALGTELSEPIAKSRWLTLIKEKMLVTDPAGRQSARACLREVEVLCRGHAQKDKPEENAAPKPVDAQPAAACVQKPEASPGQPERPMQDAAHTPSDAGPTGACLQEAKEAQRQSESREEPVKNAAAPEPENGRPPVETCPQQTEAPQGRAEEPETQAVVRPPDGQPPAHAGVLQGPTEPSNRPANGILVTGPSANSMAEASGAGIGSAETLGVTVTERPPSPPNMPPRWEMDWEGDLIMTGMEYPTCTLPELVDRDGDVAMTDAPCLS